MVSLAIPVVMKLRGDTRADFVQGMLYSFVVCAGWIYAQSIFLNERLRDTLDLLLSLPLDPFELVIAKHFSIYTMVLVTINVPMILLRDWHLLLLSNAAALFLATVILSSTVVSSARLAGQVPVLVLAGLTFATEDNLQTYYPSGLVIYKWVMTHPDFLALLAVCISPVIAVSSAAIFKHQQTS
jgi:ABC-type Na+ efflux pump permease subunit